MTWCINFGHPKHLSLARKLFNSRLPAAELFHRESCHLGQDLSHMAGSYNDLVELLVSFEHDRMVRSDITRGEHLVYQEVWYLYLESLTHEENLRLDILREEYHRTRNPETMVEIGLRIIQHKEYVHDYENRVYRSSLNEFVPPRTWLDVFTLCYTLFFTIVNPVTYGLALYISSTPFYIEVKRFLLSLTIVRHQSLTFQDPCTPIMESLSDLHTYIMVYLVGIFFLVMMGLFLVVNSFWWSLKVDIDKLLVSKCIHCDWLEMVWTIFPALVLFNMILPSLGLLYAMEEKADHYLTLKAIGHQWYWEYELVLTRPDGLSFLSFDSYLKPDTDLQLGQLRLLEVDQKILLPVHTPIRLLTTSADVIHSWALPAGGVKMDAIPGRLNQVNLYFNRTGVFYGQCSELCGVNHGFMPISVKVLDFQASLGVDVQNG